MSNKFFKNWIVIVAIILITSLFCFFENRLEKPLILKTYRDVEYNDDENKYNNKYLIKFPIIKDTKFGEEIEYMEIIEIGEPIVFHQKIGDKSIMINDLILELGTNCELKKVSHYNIGNYFLVKSELCLDDRYINRLIKNKITKINKLSVAYSDGEKKISDIGQIRFINKSNLSLKPILNQMKSYENRVCYEIKSENDIKLKEINLEVFKNYLKNIEINKIKYKVINGRVECDIPLKKGDLLEITWEMIENAINDIGDIDLNIEVGYEENKIIKKDQIKLKLKVFDIKSVKEIREFKKEMEINGIE